jgi:hypothetical protein
MKNSEIFTLVIQMESSIHQVWQIMLELKTDFATLKNYKV